MTLRESFTGKTFCLGVELVTTRGFADKGPASKVLQFGRALAGRTDIDWLSITDNAGGNPALGAEHLGGILRDLGAEVLIHLSAKDMNRNALEGRAWTLASRGLTNVLVLTGDYPIAGFRGSARPVFDMDSVTLLAMLAAMNAGMEVAAPGRAAVALEPTSFYAGVAVSPFKAHPAELLGQYLKLERKIAHGAQFIITQIGYDARKWDELRVHLEERGHRLPCIGYVYLLGKGVAGVFHRNQIPGCVVSDELLALVERQAAGPDRGKSFFIELAAKQAAILRGMGYRGAYLGGLTSPAQLDAILERLRSFSPDDWRLFAKELQFPAPNEFYMYERDPATGLADAGRRAPMPRASAPALERLGFAFNEVFHRIVFAPDAPLFGAAARVYRTLEKRPRLASAARGLENLIKAAMFGCRGCGDCSLPETTYICPESSCPKRQRNGPCGGSCRGKCEAEDRDCIWVRAFRRCGGAEKFAALLQEAAAFVDDGLRTKSSWANAFLGRDHHRYREGATHGDSGTHADR
ncbi:MAG TPA: methylenetetrahydrofolate reductase [Planctomycetes bacterium]|nr:methylenetetrahydrofolate reductase [Planctomycetota bacterium]